MTAHLRRALVLAGAVLIAVPSIVLAQSYSFTTLAGLATCGHIDGQGSAARLCRPSAMAIEASGSLLFVDDYNRYIRRVTADGRVTTVASLGCYYCSNVVAMTVAGSDLYVLWDSGALEKHAVGAGGTIASGTYLGSYKGPNGGVPRALAVDASGTPYVARECEIVKAIDSVAVNFAGAAADCTATDGTAGRFKGVTAMAFNASGTLYVADAGRPYGRIRTVSSSGTVATTLVFPDLWLDDASIALTFSSFSGINAMAFDSSGNLYATAPGAAVTGSGEWVGDGRVLKISGSTVTTLAGYAGDRGAVDGQGAGARFAVLRALAINPATGNLYVIDSQNNTVSRISSSGSATTIAGLAPVGLMKDDAWLGGIAGLAVDATGALLISDNSAGPSWLRHRIVKVEPSSGAAMTVAGLITQRGSTDGTGSDARFSYPGALTHDGTYLFVNDEGNGTIRRVDESGAVTTHATSSASGAASLIGNNPIASANGTAYVLGSLASGTISIVSVAGTSGSTVATMAVPAGVGRGGLLASGGVWYASVGHAVYRVAGASFSLVAGDLTTSGDSNLTGSNARFNSPGSLAVDSSGTIYVLDLGNAKVKKIAANGSVSLHAAITDLTPKFMGIDETGHVYVAGSDKILQIDADGTQRLIFGLRGALSYPVDGTGTGARFSNPGGVAVSSDGTVYVADTGTYTIRAVTTSGQVSTVAGVGAASVDGTAAARFYSPRAIAADAFGNVYVADNTAAIRRISSSGVVSTIAGVWNDQAVTDGDATSARFQQINGMAVTADGNTLYVTDQNTIRMVALSPAVAVTTVAGSPAATGSVDGAYLAARFYLPVGIAVDSAGTVYVADTYNGTIRKLSAGLVSTFAGVAGEQDLVDGIGTSARFVQPTGLAMDATGNLFVTDSYAIRKVTSTGVVTTIGNGALGVIGGPKVDNGFVDAVGSKARFNDPIGIAVDSSGTLFIADSSNNAIRKGVLVSGPSITTQPANASARYGATATFTVAVSSNASVSYAWQASSNGTTWGALSDGAPYSGSSTATLTIASIPATLQGTQFRCVVDNGAGTVTSNAASLMVLPPHTLSPAALTFGATKSGTTLTNVTRAQTVTVSFLSNPGPWTASAATWFTLTPSSGTGTATFSVSVVNPNDVIDGETSLASSITVTPTGAPALPASIATTLNIDQSNRGTAPFGAFDTPSDGAEGVTGSIAVTGWALDDIEVARVRIYRDPVGSETAGQLVYIGDATLVEGARTDLISAYPSLPRNTRGGWGYLLLTNFLPGLGNGTYTLYAYADDVHGNSTLVGTKTITCANSGSLTPFGAIDTPAQGETVSGTVNNFGWVLSPGTRRAYPPHGTVSVLVDGTSIGAPSGWTSRSDLSALFPRAEYDGIDTALGVLPFDSRTLTDGVHTIAWVVTDDHGGSAGVGSRYFTVLNGAASFRLKPEATRLTLGATESARGVRLQADDPLHAAGNADTTTITAFEMERIEIQVGNVTNGHLATAAGPLPLPIGSQLEAATGTFVWMPGPGFVGTYDLVFTGPNGERRVRIVLKPRY